MSDHPWRQHITARTRNQNRLKPLTGRSLAVGGLALMFASLNSLVFSLLPLQLTSPDWLLRVINALLANSLQLLVGILVLLVARVLNGRDLKLAKRLAWIEKSARWWGILLLLTIPLQIHAGTTSIEEREARENQNILQMRQRLETIKNANDQSQLRRVGANLPSLPSLLSPASPPTPPPHLESPLPVIKDRMIADLNPKLNAAQKEHLRRKPERWHSFFADAIRNGIQAGLLATAFLKITKYHYKVKTSTHSQASAPTHS
jgi:hypothetical protein